MNADRILSAFICVYLPSSAVKKIPTLDADRDGGVDITDAMSMAGSFLNQRS
ncbi:hypothetical protein [Microcoleus sp. D3_18a_C4]|uniref:hypothetical protein n=1 Tax=Microcoleus sp. D3_18a_C4 TaxID=3055332 RepID=UPI002FD6784D